MKAFQITGPGGAVDDMLRELVILQAESLLPVPAHLSPGEAATLPCAAVTARTPCTCVEVSRRVKRCWFS
jgi:NADPH:quinone reductase-like Zn-dependent oxidoreductase